MENENELDNYQTERAKTLEISIYKRKKIPSKKAKKNESKKTHIDSNQNKIIGVETEANTEQKRENHFKSQITDNSYNPKSVDKTAGKIKKKSNNKNKAKIKFEISNNSEINISTIKNDNINGFNEKEKQINFNGNEIREFKGLNESINNLEKVDEIEDKNAQKSKKLNLKIIKEVNISFFLNRQCPKDEEINKIMEIKKEENNKINKEKTNENNIIINKEGIDNKIINKENKTENCIIINILPNKAQGCENLNQLNNEIDDNYSIFEEGTNNYKPIENNNLKGQDVIKLIKEEKNNIIKIQKNLLKEVNSLITCIGPPGAGKSTFCSNYYKCLYNVKKDYFESSDSDLTHTKGIWMISNEERRKIPIMIKKDLLDVEGFQVDNIKSWKYIMIIAFLSTDLIILNRNTRSDDVKRILRIIEKSLEKMKKKQIPRILKNIYIQTCISKPKKTIKEYIEQFIENKEIFEGINFEYLYLANIDPEELSEQKDLMKFDKYKESFNNVLQKISNSNLLKNSVSSLMNYIDLFNNTINGKSGFNEQTIYKDLESDFNGVYSRYEKQLKNELSSKIDKLIKLNSLKETFKEFIEKQKDLKFVFQIKEDDLTFYGSCDNFDKFYENLKKKKSFRVAPEDIFLDTYKAQKKLLEISIKKKKFEEEKKKMEMEMKKKEKKKTSEFNTKKKRWKKKEKKEEKCK